MLVASRQLAWQLEAAAGTLAYMLASNTVGSQGGALEMRECTAATGMAIPAFGWDKHVLPTCV